MVADSKHTVTVNHNAGETEEYDGMEKVMKEKVVQGSDAMAKARATTPPKPFSKRLIQLYLICFVGLLSGIMTGIDESIMGALLVLRPFQKEFGASVDGEMAGFITAFFQIGAVASSPFIGEALDRFGRRFGIFVGCLLTIVGTVLEGTANLNHSLAQFLGGRFLLGMGTNIALSAGPTYVCEVAHPEYRGILTALQSSTQNFGGFIGALVTSRTVVYPDNRSWLIPVWIQIIPAAIVCLTVFLLPESPRWLYTHNKLEKAKDLLTKYHGEDDPNNPYVILQIAQFEEDLDVDGSDKRWWDYRCLYNTKANRFRMINTLVFVSWSSLSSGGINYFVGAFFKSAGITDPSTVLMYNLGQNIQSFLASFLGSSMCEYFGRRMLLIPTLGGMALAWTGVAVSTSMVTQSPNAGKAGIAFWLIFSLIYCIGMTPLQGIYASELLSYEQRAKGTAVARCLLYGWQMMKQFATPIGLANIGYKMYVIWAIWNGFECLVSYFIHVETKGYSLEELDDIFSAPNPVKASIEKRTLIVPVDV